jgi:hypothetical protein
MQDRLLSALASENKHSDAPYMARSPQPAGLEEELETNRILLARLKALMKKQEQLQSLPQVNITRKESSDVAVAAVDGGNGSK